MYRLMLYFLISLFGLALILTYADVISYNAWELISQALFLIGVCWGINTVLSRLAKTKNNLESQFITALILFLILGPVNLPQDWAVLAVAGAAAMASKYLIVKKKSHIFNPAAFGVFTSAFIIGQPASWWVGSLLFLPTVIIGGILVARRVHRFQLILVFLGIYLALNAITISPSVIRNIILSSPLLFFSFVMLIEPLTSPQIHKRRIYFGILVAVALFVFQYFFSQIPYSFELSLLVGNAFARIVNPDFRQSFTLEKKQEIAPSIFEFWFESKKRFSFVPGQYLEYTFSHPQADSRGVRRYFTIASSPTEKQILIATRFSPQGSSFKQALKNIEPGDEIIASKVAGDFVLPADSSRKLVFIAGGIGITPFRSIVKYLLDTNQSRDIVLLYDAKNQSDFVFKDIFEKARTRFGMRTEYIEGQIDEKIIREKVGDLAERVFYVSGPEPMVQNMEKVLSNMGIARKNIEHDYFPGYTLQ